MKMKRSYSIIIAVCLIFVLSGCADMNNEPNKTGQGTGNQMNSSQESNTPGTNNNTGNQSNNNTANNNTADNNNTGTTETKDNMADSSETGANGTKNHETGTNETNSTQTGETQTSNVISEKEAKKIALEKVPGAVEEDIKDFNVENKKNFVEYEGKIIYNGKEYEFEIDGHDGTILEWEVEEVK